MKSFLTLSLIAFSSMANAASISFNYDSVLPTSLRTIVDTVVDYSCDFKFGTVSEISTTVVARRYDQNLKDYYYTSTFEVLNKNNERVTVLTVESFDTVPGNGTVDLGVSSIKTSEGNFCK